MSGFRLSELHPCWHWGSRGPLPSPIHAVPSDGVSCNPVITLRPPPPARAHPCPGMASPRLKAFEGD